MEKKFNVITIDGVDYKLGGGSNVDIHIEDDTLVINTDGTSSGGGGGSGEGGNTGGSDGSGITKNTYEILAEEIQELSITSSLSGYIQNEALENSLKNCTFYQVVVKGILEGIEVNILMNGTVSISSTAVSTFQFGSASTEDTIIPMGGAISPTGNPGEFQLQIYSSILGENPTLVSISVITYKL